MSYVSVHAGGTGVRSTALRVRHLAVHEVEDETNAHAIPSKLQNFVLQLEMPHKLGRAGGGESVRSRVSVCFLLPTVSESSSCCNFN